MTAFSYDISRLIGYYTLVVNNHSHINEKSLREHLELNNKNLIRNELKIIIQREDIEDQTAIIHSIQGETLEKI